MERAWRQPVGDRRRAPRRRGRDRRARQAEGGRREVEAPRREKKSSDDKHKRTIDTLARTLKPGLEALGATLAPSRRAGHQLSAAKMIDANGIDVSDGGMAAIKIIAEAAKQREREDSHPRASSAAAPPKELAQPVSHGRRDERRPRGARDVVARARGRGARAHHHHRRRRRRRRRAGARQEGRARPADRVELEIEPE
jgi:hypothetical protein